MDVDLDAISAAGLDTTTMVVVTNTDDYGSVEGKTGQVNFGDDLVSLS